MYRLQHLRALMPILLVVSAAVESTAEEPASVIRTDVAVIGGGASGAYSAVRLREDFGLRVVLIEKEAILVRTIMPQFGDHAGTDVDII